MKTRMPIQSAPVERTIVGATMSNQNGVDASDVLDFLKTVGGAVAKAAIPAVLGAIGG